MKKSYFDSGGNDTELIAVLNAISHVSARMARNMTILAQQRQSEKGECRYALLQKTYTTDFLNKTRVKNNGIVPQYYVEGNHEAIIPKDIFLQVQEELVRRRVVKTSANGKKRSYSCNHCFAQIVICGEYGEMFRRIHWNNRGCKSIVWRCISRLEPTGQECHARTVNEPVLENVVVQAINTLLGDKSTYQAQLQQNIAKVIRSAQQNTADGIDGRLQVLQKELLKKANNKEAYDEIADEIFRLREQREKCTVDTAARGARCRISSSSSPHTWKPSTRSW